MRGKTPSRVVDPGRATTDNAAKRMGLKTQVDLQRSDDLQSKVVDDKLLRTTYLPTDTLSFYREDVGATGDAGYQTRQASPSGSATWGTVLLDAYMGAAGRIIGARLFSSAARTTGTATVRVRVTESGVVSDYLLGDCVLDAVNTQTIGQMLPVANGFRFAKGALIRPYIVTAGTWAPTTADMGCDVIVVYEGL